MSILPAFPPLKVAVDKPLCNLDAVEVPLASMDSEARTEIFPALPSLEAIADTLAPSRKIN